MRRIALLCTAAALGMGCDSNSANRPEVASCPAREKNCGGPCVPVTDPKTGCGEPTCEACPAARHGTAACVQATCADGPCEQGFGNCDGLTSNGCETDLLSDGLSCGACGTSCTAQNTTSTCVQGTCRVQSCASPWADCDGNGLNGCETNTQTADSNCGACGSSCPSENHCYQAKCEQNGQALAWLDDRKAGWCLDDYTKLLNLCGKVSYCKWTLCGDLNEGPPECYSDYLHEHERAVPFCCDPAFFKAYPQGIAMDVGFHYDGVSTGGVITLGGENDSGILILEFGAPGTVNAILVRGGVHEVTQTAQVSAGAHLISWYLDASGVELFVDGVKKAQTAGLAAPLQFQASAGPGFIVGSKQSYWWEADKIALRFAPFLVHLRNGDEDPSTWSIARATTAGSRTIVLFNETGMKGNEWRATAGGKSAFAINKSATGPVPAWVADVATQCW